MIRFSYKIDMFSVIIGLMVLCLATRVDSSCLNIQSLDERKERNELVRVWSDAVSFKLIYPFRMKRIDSPDSDVFLWEGSGYSVMYERFITRKIDRAYPGCFNYSGEITAMVCPSGSGVLILLNDPYEHGLHTVFVKASFFMMLRIASDVVRTWMNINKWDRLILLHTDTSSNFACVKNEIGVVRLVRIGDVITRDFGEVREINDNNIVVVELLHDGLGGFVEARRILQIDGFDE